MKCKSEVTGDEAREKVSPFRKSSNAKEPGLYSMSTRVPTQSFNPWEVWLDHLEAVTIASERQTFGRKNLGHRVRSVDLGD